MSAENVVLVTGASGFLGRRVVEMLVARGYRVRALVRRTSKIAQLQLPGVETVIGDVTNATGLREIFLGASYVIHAAADTSGTREGASRVTVEGTRNILALCAEHQVRKLVYISSCSVYGVAGCCPGQVLNEDAGVEPYPERRGAYSWGKQAAEQLVLEKMQEETIRAVCLRPGVIYGNGGENYNPLIGLAVRNWLFVVFTQSGFVLPLVYLDNLVEAILVAMSNPRSTGEVYNVVDPWPVNKKQYMDTLIRKLHQRVPVLYLPYGLLAKLVTLQEKIFRGCNRQPLLSRYRLDSSQRPVVYDASKLARELDWRPKASFAEAVEQILATASGR